MRKILCGIAALSFYTAVHAANEVNLVASDQSGRYFSVSGHYMVPDSARDADEGLGGRLLWGFPISERGSIEFSASATDFKRETDPKSDDFIYTGGADYVYHAAKLRNRHDYPSIFGLVGGGIFHDDTRRTRDTTSYVNAGVGALFPTAWAPAFFRLEARKIFALNDSAPQEAGVTNDKQFDETSFAFGLQYDFIVNRYEEIAECATCEIDSDRDGILDGQDFCPGTPFNAPVDPRGCSIDTDKDGVIDYYDHCPGTPPNTPVDHRGCSNDRDTDGDSVPDKIDQCPNTPKGAPVDAKGCPLDDDEDKVINYYDHCPRTAPNVAVDIKGCALDRDRDGILNDADSCPNNYPGLTVDPTGCPVGPKTINFHNVHFDFDKDTIKVTSLSILNQMANDMIDNPTLSFEIGGHTDSMGSDYYNLDLSARRAAAVVTYLTERGVDGIRLRSRGYGESKPIATNQTDAGRALNRRVELTVIDAK